MMLLTTLQTAGALLLSYIFLAAGLHKMRNPVSFQQVMADYDLLPQRAIYPALLLLVSLEIAAGLSLLVAPLVNWGAMLAAGLLFLYLAAMTVNLVRGKELRDCGCGGPAQGQQLSGWLLVRNLVLLCFASVLLRPMGGFGISWLLAVPAALFLIGLYHVGDQLLLNRGKLDDLRVSLEEA